MHSHIKFGRGILQRLTLVLVVVTVHIARLGLQFLLVELEIAKIKEHGFSNEQLQR